MSTPTGTDSGAPKDPFARNTADLLRAIDAAGALAENEQAHQRELGELFLSLTDVLDSFDRLLAPGPDGTSAEACLHTSRLIARQLELTLKRSGMTTFGAPGDAGDAGRHAVVDVRAQPATADGVVIEVLRRGCEWSGRVLRPAEVIVVHNQEGNA